MYDSQGRSHGGEWGGPDPTLLFWRSFLILSKPGRNVWGGGAKLPWTLHYLSIHRISGYWALGPPPTSLGLATPLMTVNCFYFGRFFLLQIFMFFSGYLAFTSGRKFGLTNVQEAYLGRSFVIDTQSMSFSSASTAEYNLQIQKHNAIFDDKVKTTGDNLVETIWVSYLIFLLLL